MGYYSSSRSKELTLGQVVFTFIVVGGLFLYIILYRRISDKDIQNKKYSSSPNNPKAVSSIAQTIGSTYLDSFNQVIKDVEKMDALCYFFDSKFTKVIEKENEDGSKIYIGDLEWFIKHGSKGIDGISIDYDSINGYTGKASKYKRYTTLCVCYDDNFSLPHFELVRETIEKKASELLRREATEDIDFEEDKEFSDSWWLSSNENVLVRELFDKKVRKTFMSFVDRDYVICGHQNHIIILAGKIINPNTYKYVFSEMNKIQTVFKENGKFYKES